MGRNSDGVDFSSRQYAAFRGPRGFAGEVTLRLVESGVRFDSLEIGSRILG